MVIENNGKRTEVRFQGTLLVPVEVWVSPCNFLWTGSLHSSDTTVDVIAFNTSKKDDFARLLQENLDALRKQEPSDRILNQISFIERTLSEMSDSVFIKRPEESLLEAASRQVSDFMRRGGVYVQPHLTRDNTIYLAGVSAMYNN